MTMIVIVFCAFKEFHLKRKNKMSLLASLPCFFTLSSFFASRYFALSPTLTLVHSTRDEEPGEEKSENREDTDTEDLAMFFLFFPHHSGRSSIAWSSFSSSTAKRVLFTFFHVGDRFTDPFAFTRCVLFSWLVSVSYPSSTGFFSSLFFTLFLQLVLPLFLSLSFSPRLSSSKKEKKL